MPTLSSEPEGTAATGTGGYDRAQASHLQRQVAEGFGADAARYDRARPAYPAGLVDRIIAASPGPDVLDVGCGTASAPGCSRRPAAGCSACLGSAVDAAGGTFTVSYATIAATAARLAW